jgi:hypothetical protein
VLDLAGEDRMGWAHLWPHARPWALRKPQPSLRCLRDADKVAALLQSAWAAANPGLAASIGQPATPAVAPVAPATQGAPAAPATLAGQTMVHRHAVSA